MRKLGPVLVFLGVGVTTVSAVFLAPAQRAAVASAGRVQLGSAEAAAIPGAASRARLVGWSSERGIPFALGLGLLVSGGLLVRRAEAARASGSGVGEGARDLGVQLRALRDALAGFERDLVTEGPAGHEAIRQQIGGLQQQEVPLLIEAGPRLRRARGVARMAEVMGPFAGAERAMNRAWSALTDGYPEEARRSLGRAVAGLDAAVAALGSEPDPKEQAEDQTEDNIV